jgi:hypothetical protein
VIRTLRFGSLLRLNLLRLTYLFRVFSRREVPRLLD